MKINNLSKESAVSEKVKTTSVSADGACEKQEAVIITEHAMDIIVNEKKIMQLSCTGTNLCELVVGRLVTEGIIETFDDVETIQICESGLRATVFLAHDIQFEEIIEKEKTCCTQNKVFSRSLSQKELKEVKPAVWKNEWIFNLANEFAKDSGIHNATKGTHCCYLGVESDVIASFEDIGRHNAVDKTIGYALINGISFNRCILFTTGRVPTDMVAKAVAAGIPVLVSKAVPTDEAVAMAKKYKLALICKAWTDRFEIFNDARREIRE